MNNNYYISLLFYLFIAALIIILAFYPYSVKSHEASGGGWKYDPDCCDDRDCAVAEVEMKSNTVWIFKTIKGIVSINPKETKFLPSKDNNYHACIYSDYNNSEIKRVRCIYAPGGT